MTSPELPMKRLLAEGSGPIAQITRAFRNGEVSPRHNPEFTLAEWYRPGWTYRELMAEVEDVVDELAKRHGQRHPLPRPFPRVGVLEALARLGVGPDRVQDPATLRAACRSRALVPPEDADAETLYHFLLATAVEPALSPEGPAFLVDYPEFHASLARVRAGPWPVAERFELFLSGLEIANGFSELTDASEQRRRCEADTRARGAAGLKPYPLDEAFLAALETGLPECAGVAVGVDRLVMWLLDVPSIQDVLCYPYA